MKTFEEIQVIVQGRLQKARAVVQDYKDQKERERRPVPIPPTPSKPTKTNTNRKAT